MNQFGLTFHHLGLAVKTKMAAIQFLQGLGYVIGADVYDHHQEANVIMCKNDQQPDVEIIFPTENSGPLDKFLQSQDTLIYHICYSCENIARSIEKIKAANIRVIPVSPEKPAKLFDYAPVAFYFIKGFGLIELVQESEFKR